MNPSTLIIAAIIAIVTIVILARHFRNLKNGKGCSCGGNCGACGCGCGCDGSEKCN